MEPELVECSTSGALHSSVGLRALTSRRALLSLVVDAGHVEVAVQDAPGGAGAVVDSVGTPDPRY